MRTMHMVAWLVVAVVVGVVGVWAWADEPKAEEKPQWQRMLTGEDAKRAAELTAQANQARDAGKFELAIQAGDALLRLREKVQGKTHWQAVSTREAVEAMRLLLNASDEDRRAYLANSAMRREAQELETRGDYRAAEPLRQKILTILRRVLGEKHSFTGRAYHNLAANHNAQRKYEDAEQESAKGLAICLAALGEEHPDTASAYLGLGVNQHNQFKLDDSERNFTKTLKIRREVLGEQHPDTAEAYLRLAENQLKQGESGQAAQGFTEALAIYRATPDPDTRDVAMCHAGLATTLSLQGRHEEAERGAKEALVRLRQTHGEQHIDVANAVGHLAIHQQAQGKYAEAEQGFLKALTIVRAVRGDQHFETAAALINLSVNQSTQGKFAQAEQGFLNAGKVFSSTPGDTRLLVAKATHGLAGIQSSQNRHADAEQSYGIVLDLYNQVLGESSLECAKIACNLAIAEHQQGKYSRSEERLNKALGIYRATIGDSHPDTALVYVNLAAVHNALGKFALAERELHKALAISSKALGNDHPDTILVRTNFGAFYWSRGKYDEAERQLTEAVDSFTRSRLHFAASGLDRSISTANTSSPTLLPVVLAAIQKPKLAYQRFEQSRGRGTLDDLYARLRLSTADQSRQTELTNRLDRLSTLLAPLMVSDKLTDEQKQRRDLYLTRQSQVQDELHKFLRTLEEKYGPVAGEVFAVTDIQAALPSDVALVGYSDFLPTSPKDVGSGHWAFLLLPQGDPIVVRLPGTGKDQAWTDADTALSDQLLAALNTPKGDWRPFADRLYKQRLDPLANYLVGIKRLVVLPSTALSGVPVEVFAEKFTISYAPSGTIYTHLRKQKLPTSAGLLALADPRFDSTPPKERPLPPHGLLVTNVVPGSNAAVADIRTDDVLLRYGDTKLTKRDDLKTLPAMDKAKADIPVLVWRNGETFQKPRFVQPGKLGVAIADDSARVILEKRYKLDSMLVSRGDDKLAPLPGTRIEAESLRRLFDDKPVTLLADGAASEQGLHSLSKAGDLAKFRYIHLATHAQANTRFFMRSAVKLACDSIPDGQTQFEKGEPVFDGQLTAEEVLRNWHLNADLVTLSACQTALGTHEHGEGHLGFAQAMLLAGSRSVVLSQWKVDDGATALLMERFYANLLGKRLDLNGKPIPAMSKADALHEAKHWLRTVSRDEVLKRSAELTNGVVRGERGAGEPKRPQLPEAPKVVVDGKDEPPYAHPYYWAAFILVGDDR